MWWVDEGRGGDGRDGTRVLEAKKCAMGRDAREKKGRGWSGGRSAIERGWSV